MKKLGAGYAVYRNFKDKRVGTIFQGGYKGKKVTDENYLRYLDVYIQVINVFELFPGGIEAAAKILTKRFNSR